MRPAAYITRAYFRLAASDLAVRFTRTLTSWRDNPDMLRRALRDGAPGQIMCCAILGAMVGALIVGIHHMLGSVHSYIFDIPRGAHISSADHVNRIRILLIPLFGGLLLGFMTFLRHRLKLRDVVDPIEANAIHGGNLSLFGSLRLLFASIVSNGSGASVGMEAAYTQIGSAILSAIGKILHLRREDLRVFVAAGAAAAIGAAFNAPLAGAFYGFELILGAYTVGAISHVAAGALFGTLAAQVFTGGEPLFAIAFEDITLPNSYYLVFLLEGILAALLAILTMMSVTRYEQLSRRLGIPEWGRPCIGGAVLGIVAVGFPQVLGSGQGAITYHLNETWAVVPLLALLAAKIFGSVVSIGSGFRGGLFSASLLIGCLFGQIFGLCIGIFLPHGEEFLTLFILVGMGAIAASIVGAPVTIVLLILEMTGSLTATTSVLMGVLVSSALTRHYFGYSFSTWRFHVRGLRIRGAQDVGWIDTIRVSQLMRTELATLAADTLLSQLPQTLLAQDASRLFVVGAQQEYLGHVTLNEIKSQLDKDGAVTIASIAHSAAHVLLPNHNIRQALDMFTQWETEELPVVASLDSPTLLGVLEESHTLRRYAQELEARNMAQFGTASPSSS